MAGDKPENPQAFACASENGHQEGMTLHDFAVVHFMAAQMSTLTTENLATMATPMKRVRQVIAQSSHAYADAMLEERGK